MAQCPNHADRTPSLSIMEFRDGNVWLHCFAGCKTDDVLERLELSYADLFCVRTQIVGPDTVPGRELPPAWANPLARAVLDVLHDHAFNGPTCHPSQDLIAREIRHIHGWPTTRETVNRVCAWLRERGFIDWHYERAPGAKWWHCVYKLHCAWVRPLRTRLLKRLDSLRSTSSKDPCFPPVPFSVISTPGANGNGPHDLDFDRLEAQPARAGPP